MNGCGGNVRVITYKTIKEQRIVLLGGKLTPEDLCRHLNISFPLDHGLWDNYTTRKELCKQRYDGWIQSIASEPTRKKGREVLLCNRDVVEQVQVESIWDYMRRTRNGWNKLLDENLVSELITNEDVDYLRFAATHLNIPWDKMLSNPASLDVRTFRSEAAQSQSADGNELQGREQQGQAMTPLASQDHLKQLQATLSQRQQDLNARERATHEEHTQALARTESLVQRMKNMASADTKKAV